MIFGFVIFVMLSILRVSYCQEVANLRFGEYIGDVSTITYSEECCSTDGTSCDEKLPKKCNKSKKKCQKKCEGEWISPDVISDDTLPDGSVLCPDQPQENYCDCDGDCTEQPSWCACTEAKDCCGAALGTVLSYIDDFPHIDDDDGGDGGDHGHYGGDDDYYDEDDDDYSMSTFGAIVVKNID